ncbi:MAG TPA: hypothetical protein VGX76_04505 [Pirellulales bacterium]|jgi:hypothetical protein|nr:hypothetical protein [Pirellulales bacterium]
MPKPNRPRWPPRRKRPPDRIDPLCAAVEELTAERAARSSGPQWVSGHDVARRLGIEDDAAQQAIAEAVEAERLTTDGSSPPHSVPLFLGLRA